ncbi:MAG: leucine-rich repeat domain-containing protein [Promethearchaeota archaeon]
MFFYILRIFERVYLDTNNIKRIQGLKTLINLQRLHLGNNQISKVEGIKHLKNLESLDLC